MINEEPALDNPAYSKIVQLEDRCSFVSKNLVSARHCQKINYDKHRRDIKFKEQEFGCNPNLSPKLRSLLQSNLALHGKAQIE